ALYDQGLAVLCPELGFTQSHILVVDVTKYGDGGTLEKKLESANIILNRNLLPWDPREGRHYKNPGGIRLGTSEVTRLGMKEGEMKQIAEFIRRIVIDNEDPQEVAREVAEFRREFQKVHYCFESATEAYEYIKIR
ncbi:MAG: serine hydroxymethyltransferase, partial [Candidatus Hadarchaeum sp.]